MSFRQHPITQLVSDAANHGRRGLPSTSELDALNLPPSIRTRVKAACEEVASVHDEGFHADAWQRGDELAAAAISDLPDDLQSPDYLQPREGLNDLPPAELIAHIPRSGL